MLQAAARKHHLPEFPGKYRIRPTRETTHRAYWIGKHLLPDRQPYPGLYSHHHGLSVQELKTTVNALSALGNNVLGGLYGNFVKMDEASINNHASGCPNPAQFQLPVSQNTTVVLTRM